MRSAPWMKAAAVFPLLAGAGAADEAKTPVPDGIGDAIAGVSEAASKADLETLASSIEEKLALIDSTIATFDGQLLDLYDRREAATSDARRRALDDVIDRLSVNLDEMEGLRGTLSEQLQAIRQIAEETAAPTESSPLKPETK